MSTPAHEILKKENEALQTELDGLTAALAELQLHHAAKIAVLNELQGLADDFTFMGGTRKLFVNAPRKHHGGISPIDYHDFYQSDSIKQTFARAHQLLEICDQKSEADQEQSYCLEIETLQSILTLISNLVISSDVKGYHTGMLKLKVLASILEEYHHKHKKNNLAPRIYEHLFPAISHDSFLIFDDLKEEKKEALIEKIVEDSISTFSTFTSLITESEQKNSLQFVSLVYAVILHAKASFSYEPPMIDYLDRICHYINLDFDNLRVAQIFAQPGVSKLMNKNT